MLQELWWRREVARPALDYAARATAPPVPVTAPPWPVYGVYGHANGYGMAGSGPVTGAGHGVGLGLGHGVGAGYGYGYGYGYGAAGYGHQAGPYPAYNPYQP